MDAKQIERIRESVVRSVEIARKTVQGAAELGLGTDYAELCLGDWQALLRLLDDMAAKSDDQRLLRELLKPEEAPVRIPAKDRPEASTRAGEMALRVVANREYEASKCQACHGTMLVWRKCECGDPTCTRNIPFRCAACGGIHG